MMHHIVYQIWCLLCSHLDWCLYNLVSFDFLECISHAWRCAYVLLWYDPWIRRDCVPWTMDRSTSISQIDLHFSMYLYWRLLSPVAYEVPTGSFIDLRLPYFTVQSKIKNKNKKKGKTEAWLLVWRLEKACNWSYSFHSVFQINLKLTWVQSWDSMAHRILSGIVS